MLRQAQHEGGTGQKSKVSDQHSAAPLNDDQTMTGPFWDCARAVMATAKGYADELTAAEILRAITTAQFSLAVNECVPSETMEQLCSDLIHSMKAEGS